MTFNITATAPLTNPANTWFLLQTHPKQEDRVVSNLATSQVECFAPKMKGRRTNSFTGAVTYFPKPLFPSYVFARFCLNDELHRVSFTRGVRRIVSFGAVPTVVDPAVIELLKARSGADGFVTIGEPLRLGDQVIIQAGHLQGLRGLLERELSDAERVMVLLNTVKFQTHVIIERHLVAKCDEQARP